MWYVTKQRQLRSIMSNQHIELLLVEDWSLGEDVSALHNSK